MVADSLAVAARLKLYWHRSAKQVIDRICVGCSQHYAAAVWVTALFLTEGMFGQTPM